MLSKTLLLTFSASSLFVAIAVGCATPAVGSVSNDDTSARNNAASTTSTPTGAAVDSGAATTTVTDAGATSQSACFSACIAATPAAATFETCKATCADVTCETSCFNTSCATNPAACNTAIAACQTACPATTTTTPTTPDGGSTVASCTDSCVEATNASAYWVCKRANACPDKTDCDDDCFFDSICGQTNFTINACDSIVGQCRTQCNDPGL